MKKYFRQRGVAAIELAILLPLLLFVVFGITEFGRALYSYNTILKGTRDAARYASQQQPGTEYFATQCLAVYGKVDCVPGVDTPLAPGLTIAMVTVCDWKLDYDSGGVTCPGHYQQGTNPLVNLVSVTVSGYTFHSFVPFVTAGLQAIIFGPMSTTMRGNL